MLKKTLTKNVYDCSTNDLVNVVADVKSYADFVPFCSAVEVSDSTFSEEIERFSARLFVDFKFTNETFSTKVAVNRKMKNILITGNAKPFKYLVADWSFVEHDDLCKVDFSIEVSFNSFIKEKLVSVSFEKIALKIIEAFESRAKKNFI